MGVIFIMIAAMIAMSAMGVFGLVNEVFSSAFSGVPVVVMIIGIVVLGGVMREAVKSKKNDSRASQKELGEIRQSIAKIEADIAEIKEHIADFIINQV